MTTYFRRARSRNYPHIVDEYSELRLPLRHAMLITYPARPHSFIEFSLGDPYKTGDTIHAPAEASSDVMICAPHIRRLPVVRLDGNVHEFHIGFQPTAIHRLSGIHVKEMTDQVVRARDVFGWRIDLLRDAVMGAESFEARIVATDRWFEFMLETARPIDTMDAIAHKLRRGSGRARIDMLQRLSGLSERQWRREFKKRVGVSPKSFARVSRLDGAFSLHYQHPELSWTEIAIALGYYDHSHMLLDARELLHLTPAEWLKANPWPFGTVEKPRAPPS